MKPFVVRCQFLPQTPGFPHRADSDILVCESPDFHLFFALSYTYVFKTVAGNLVLVSNVQLRRWPNLSRGRDQIPRQRTALVSKRKIRVYYGITELFFR
ncbi:hypothetical protein PoB_006858700 [Plakobranchus ocellatus]|uniref:Uncharacterized protein n=1 Tax=Plakobranchus ocellatus TaxID=259542 RepID=A0AAV4DDH5_9GAST|nr:hypothetical protein PoB_006858700 [Plakobranchus ocellatus]